MKLFRSSKSPLNTSRAARVESNRPRVQSYYTATKRTSQGSDEGRGKNQRKNTLSFKDIISANGSIGLYVGLAALAVFLFATLTSLSSEPIISINKPTPKHRLDKYEDFAKDRLQSSILNSSKLTLRSSNISDAMKQQFPELSDVEVSSVLLGKKPDITLTRLDIPYRVKSGAKTYMVSSAGVVVGEESELQDMSDKTVINLTDDSGATISKGQRIIRSDDSSFYSVLAKMFESRGRGVDSIRLSAVPREAFIRPSGAAYDLRVYLDDSAGEQLARYFVVEKLLQGRGEAPVKYIDLRAGEKVYWQ
jgi:hypothetical protein